MVTFFVFWSQRKRTELEPNTELISTRNELKQAWLVTPWVMLSQEKNIIPQTPGNVFQCNSSIILELHGQTNPNGSPETQSAQKRFPVKERNCGRFINYSFTPTADSFLRRSRYSSTSLSLSLFSFFKFSERVEKKKKIDPRLHGSQETITLMPRVTQEKHAHGINFRSTFTGR